MLFKKNDYLSKNLHITNDDTTGAVYCYRTNTVCMTTVENAKSLKLLQKAHENKHNDEFVQIVDNAFSNDDLLKKVELRSCLQTDTIPVLVLLVQMDCNLNCKYCYAEGGAYGKETQHMDSLTAAHMVRTLVKKTNVKCIERIKFFGGEPCRYPEVIKTVCAEFKKMAQEKVLIHEPIYSIVTNGTYYTKSLSKLFVDNNFKVTFSLDGEKQLNDQLRIFSNGNGTYDVVTKNIKNFVEDGVKLNNIAIEATYTKLHVKYNITPESISSFFQKELGVSFVMIMPCTGSVDFALPPKQVSDMQIRSIKKSFENIRNNVLEEGYNADIINISIPFASKIKRSLQCPIMCSEITITPNGEIFPCFMYMEDSFLIGKYNSDHSAIAFFDQEFVLSTIKSQLSQAVDVECTNCWARNLCNYCPKRTSLQKRSFYDLNGERKCIYRENAEAVMLEIARLSNDQHLLEKFLELF